MVVKIDMLIKGLLASFSGWPNLNIFNIQTSQVVRKQVESLSGVVCCRTGFQYKTYWRNKK